MTLLPITQNTDELKKVAQLLRLDVFDMLAHAESGHIGWALGMADVFAVLYFSFLQLFPENPKNLERDYCLLSNGHICPIWYAALARRGFFPMAQLDSLRKIGSLLQWHPKNSIPGVENSSGPLGHWLSQAVGIALALRMDKKCNKVVCCMSDGEHQEGQIWEAIMSASKFWLSNLIGIVDLNGLQIEGTTDEIMPIGDLAEKYRTFGWYVLSIDGNNMEEIQSALAEASKSEKPCVIIAHTVLGKGISSMESDWKYHDWQWKLVNKEMARAELEHSF